MVTKSKTRQKKGSVPVGKLKLNKETVKDLAAEDLKKVKGGLVVTTILGIIIPPLLPETTQCPPPVVKK